MGRNSKGVRRYTGRNTIGGGNPSFFMCGNQIMEALRCYVNCAGVDIRKIIGRYYVNLGRLHKMVMLRYYVNRKLIGSPPPMASRLCKPRRGLHNFQPKPAKPCCRRVSQNGRPSPPNYVNYGLHKILHAIRKCLCP